MRARTAIALLATVVTIMAITIVPALAGGNRKAETTSHSVEPQIVVDTGVVEVEGGKIAISAYAITLDGAGD